MPSFLRCALSGAYMTDPVIVCSKDPPPPLVQGTSYERTALEAWIEANQEVQYVGNAVLKRVLLDIIKRTPALSPSEC
jgi:hypothetical protein